MSDIPSSGGVRDAWKEWSTDRKQAAICIALHWIVIKSLPAGVACTPGSDIKDKAVRRDQEMVILRQHAEFDWRVLGTRRPYRFSGRGS